jgi:hypothetical protein
MQIKFILNIKNKKSKLNNIHYKLNVFQKKNIKWNFKGK